MDSKYSRVMSAKVEKAYGDLNLVIHAIDDVARELRMLKEQKRFWLDKKTVVVRSDTTKKKTFKAKPLYTSWDGVCLEINEAALAIMFDAKIGEIEKGLALKEAEARTALAALRAALKGEK